MLSDHFLERFDYPITDTRPFRDETFTTILGAEIHAPAIGTGEMWHMVAAGLPLDFIPTSGTETGAELAARAADAGAFIGLAHPAWYHLSLEDAHSIQSAHAIEIYNHGSALYSDRGDGFYLLDQLLAEGRHLSGFASDDAHFVHGDDGAGGWIMVRTEELDPDALVEALKKGQYYFSQGPAIRRIVIENDTAIVTCTPAKAVVATGYSSRSSRVLGAGITEARLPLSVFDNAYCRITVTDSFGRRAWTNPIWLNDLH